MFNLKKKNLQIEKSKKNIDIFIYLLYPKLLKYPAQAPLKEPIILIPNNDMAPRHVYIYLYKG